MEQEPDTGPSLLQRAYSATISTCILLILWPRAKFVSSQLGSCLAAGCSEPGCQCVRAARQQPPSLCHLRAARVHKCTAACPDVLRRLHNQQAPT